MEPTDLSRILRRACHDLRTPVRGIRAHSELLLRDAGSRLPDDLTERIGFITAGAKSIDSLIDAMSGYATALETNSATFQSTRVDVMLRGVLAKLAPALKELGAEVTYGELPRVNADPDRLMQLFEQLIRNSLDHRGEDAPRIRIAAEKLSGAEWTFSVSDNGPGVEVEELERVFQPFERVHGKGAGLGLAACRAIVEGHRGRIWAERPSGGGFAIRFTLPE